ncbi:hypothetical protein NYV35_25685 [Escherichia coli]|nr:hypothetical protein [Escherichia coli]
MGKVPFKARKSANDQIATVKHWISNWRSTGKLAHWLRPDQETQLSASWK